MFENILYQNATSLLKFDLEKNNLPKSMLFVGPRSLGKFTAALELSRVLNCMNSPKGDPDCLCEGCRKSRMLLNPNVLVLGAGNRSLEIAAAKANLLFQNANSTDRTDAARYNYIRAVRKLTVRFSSVLWEGEDKFAKFSPLLQSIDENLEVLDPSRSIPEPEELGKVLDELEKLCGKLEDSFLYDSIPISQIRNSSSWAHLSAEAGKKVIIIENAEKMADGSRNALLKILEEPPKDLVFILTTSRRGAILPTILSRVRVYNFYECTAAQHREIIESNFYFDTEYGRAAFPETVDKFFRNYLPVKPESIFYSAKKFFSAAAKNSMPDIQKTISDCGNFSPSVLFSIFLEGLIDFQRDLMSTPEGAAASVKVLKAVMETSNNVEIYNQTVQGALEKLSSRLVEINMEHENIFKELLDE